MFCTNCGARIPDGSKFCENCGTAVAQEKTEQISAEPQKPVEISETQKKKSPKKIILLCVVVVVVVLALGIAGYSYYDAKILPNKIIDEVEAMTLDGYEIPIGTAMNTFFDVQSGNDYEWMVDESGGRYYITAEGETYAADYAFNFWYSRTHNEKSTYVEIASVTADGHTLDKKSDEYNDFLDEVFGSTVQNDDIADADAAAPENVEEALPETEPVEEVEQPEEVTVDEPEEDVQQESENTVVADDASVIAEDEYVYYDWFADYSLKFLYTGETEGRFELHLAETDEETGLTSSVDCEGTFIMDESSKGIVDGVLYVYDSDVTMDYRIYYVDDHYELELWGIDDDSGYITLYEEEWSSQHAG